MSPIRLAYGSSSSQFMRIWQPDQDTLDALRKGADELEDKVEGVGLAAE